MNMEIPKQVLVARGSLTGSLPSAQLQSALLLREVDLSDTVTVTLVPNKAAPAPDSFTLRQYVTPSPLLSTTHGGPPVSFPPMLLQRSHVAIKLNPKGEPIFSVGSRDTPARSYTVLSRARPSNDPAPTQPATETFSRQQNQWPPAHSPMPCPMCEAALVPFHSNSWHCNICLSGADLGGETSMGCFQCDFDACHDCYQKLASRA